MQVLPYLSFDGRCEEALNFYKTAVGAKVGMMMRFSEAPPQAPDPSQQPPQAAGGCGGALPHQIMHASFTVGDSVVMASDGMPAGQGGFKGVTLSVSVTDDAEAKRIFSALADSGEVRMPLAETFFATSFGMLADRFGVPWMVVAPKPMG